MINITNLIIWFIVGFIIVYFIRALHINKTLKKKVVSNSQIDSFAFKQSYKKAVVFFPFYFFPVWILCSYFYFTYSSFQNVILEGIVVAVIWFLLLIIFDLLIWLQRKKKWKMSWKEIYLKSQPWNLLMYYTIVISPIIVALIIYNK